VPSPLPARRSALQPRIAAMTAKRCPSPAPAEGRPADKQAAADPQKSKFPVPDWKPPPRPFADVEEAYRRQCASEPVLVGRSCSLVPLRVAHAEALFEAFGSLTQTATTQDVWKYLPSGPYHSCAQLRAWIEEVAIPAKDNFFMTVFDGPEPSRARAVGYIAYLRIQPEAGSIEVGHVTLSPLLQRTRAATELQFLMMRHAFELGYRRYEWKCDSANVNSRRAAARLGFSYEGLHRQALVNKGLNRDTTWFSVIDGEWPALRAAYEQFLADSNFDPATGAQKMALSGLTAPLLAALDPALQSDDAAPRR